MPKRPSGVGVGKRNGVRPVPPMAPPYVRTGCVQKTVIYIYIIFCIKARRGSYHAIQKGWHEGAQNISIVFFLAATPRLSHTDPTLIPHGYRLVHVVSTTKTANAYK